MNGRCRASRLGREHHDDLAHFMVGMGYIREALHLPGLSRRLEFDLAINCGELPRALHCLLSMSGTKNFAAAEAESVESLGVLALGTHQSSTAQSVAGVTRFAQDFLELIDAADATGQRDIAMAALKRLAAAGLVEGALKPSQQRSLALQLAAHGEMSRLAVSCIFSFL
ncbi:hypothetical protein CBR_g53818 [Chara braunii]|uniref:Uncharacterized protein n=1 Tax=Chara braunii TaxID=69332 RepID=A0A388K734_CHABU|nr:hypothetical protein CBR_g53818 [Chara braunii]|eukprot:GBG65846.1 hypothetical protein CBR_g53818 [Chara braunii]